MSKSVVGSINSSKNKLNNEIILIFNPNPNTLFFFFFLIDGSILKKLKEYKVCCRGGSHRPDPNSQYNQKEKKTINQKEKKNYKVKVCKSQPVRVAHSGAQVVGMVRVNRWYSSKNVSALLSITCGGV